MKFYRGKVYQENPFPKYTLGDLVVLVLVESTSEYGGRIAINGRQIDATKNRCVGCRFYNKDPWQAFSVQKTKVTRAQFDAMWDLLPYDD